MVMNANYKKRRKIEVFKFWNENILYEITKFIKNRKDFMNLAQTCKNFYEWLLNNEVTLNLMFKNFKFTKLPNILPNYLSNLKSLVIKERLKEEYKLQLFTKIEKLNLNSSVIGNVLENFKNLKKLKLKHCNIYQKINFKVFTKNLTDLDISYTLINNFNEINTLQNLQSLTIAGVKNIDKNCLQNFINLKKLKVSHSEFNEEYFTLLKNLEYLNVASFPKFTGKCLKSLQNLKTLKLKYLEGDYFKEKYLEKLLKLEKLKILSSNCKNISSIKLPNNLPKSLQQLLIPKLEVTDEQIQNLQNLKVLDLNSCYTLKGTCFKNFKNLEKLFMSSTTITENYFLNLNFKNIKYLNIIDCNEIDGNILLNFENLIHLKIGGYYCNIKDEHFKNLKKLKYLCLLECKDITDNLFLNLLNLTNLVISNFDIFNTITGINFKYLNKLKNLGITGGNNLIEENLIELFNLKKLHISDCKNFTGKCLQFLPNLKSFRCFFEDYLDDTIEFTKKELRDLINLLKKDEISIQDYFNEIRMESENNTDEEEEEYYEHEMTETVYY